MDVDQQSRLRRAGILTGLAAALLLLAGCSGGIHRRGDQQFWITGKYGTAIKGTAVWPSADGHADNAGVSLGYSYFVRDRFALMGALTPYRNYNQRDGDTYAGEFQIGLRYYFWEFDLGKVPVGLFAEAFGGIMHGERSIPEGGTSTNFTQDTGVGFEARLTDNVSWLAGYHLRHLSHGHIFGSGDNPSQNDHQVFMGIAITW